MHGSMQYTRKRSEFRRQSSTIASLRRLKSTVSVDKAQLESVVEDSNESSVRKRTSVFPVVLAVFIYALSRFALRSSFEHLEFLVDGIVVGCGLLLIRALIRQADQFRQFKSKSAHSSLTWKGFVECKYRYDSICRINL